MMELLSPVHGPKLLGWMERFETLIDLVVPREALRKIESCERAHAHLSGGELTMVHLSGRRVAASCEAGMWDCDSLAPLGNWATQARPNSARENPRVGSSRGLGANQAADWIPQAQPRPFVPRAAGLQPTVTAGSDGGPHQNTSTG